MSVSGKRLALFGLAVLFLAATLTPLIPTKKAYAAQLTPRVFTLQANGTTGGTTPGGVVNHQFTFTTPTGGSVGSIKFLYCTTSALACTMPTGLVTTGATMGTQTGATGFTINHSLGNGSPYITRTAASITGGTSLTFQLLGVTNPTADNTSFFVRISLYASTNVTGSAIDTGTVTASTSTQIVLTGIMPESIIFCAGQTVGTTSGVPDCTTATPGLIDFNQLFSPTDTAVAMSQMAASTNAASGYSITVSGPTLTSGANSIAGMSSATTSVKGTPQFGLNLRANTSASAASFPGTVSPYISLDVAPASNTTTLKAKPATDYNTANTFKFLSGDAVAASDDGGGGPTDAQIYTASYIVNVSGRQASGTYVSTLTYTCTATF